MNVPNPSPASRIFLGRLVKAFGIKGEIKFAGSDDFWVDVLESKNLVVEQIVDGAPRVHPVRITHFRPHGVHLVVRIDGVDDRNGAEALVGSEFYIDEDQIDVTLPEVELPYQVVGRTVRLEDGREIGTITSVIFSAAHPVYEVTGESGVVLIPGVDEFVVARDEDDGAITIRPIPGLIDE